VHRRFLPVPFWLFVYKHNLEDGNEPYHISKVISPVTDFSS